MSSDVVDVEDTGGTECQQLDQLVMEEASEHPAVGASLHDPRASDNSCVMVSYSNASTNASQLDSNGCEFDLGSPGSISRPQIQPTAFARGSDARQQFPLMQSTEASTPEKEEEEKSTETFVGAAAAPALVHVSGDQPAAPVSPAELTIGDDWPLVSASLGTAMTTEQAAAAVAVVTAEASASLVISPPHQDRDLQNNPAMGARVAGALAYLGPEERCQRSHRPAFKLPQPELQSKPEPPTPLRQPAEARTPNEAQPSRFLPTADDGAEAKGQDCISTTNVTVALVRGAEADGQVRQPIGGAATVKAEAKADAAWRERVPISEAPSSSISNAYLAKAASKERGKQPATTDATAKAQPKVDEMFRKWRSNAQAPQATSTRSVKGVVDRLAAVVAEAKEKRKKNQGASGVGNILGSAAGGRMGSRQGSVRRGLGSRLSIGRPGAFESHQPRRERDMQVKMRIDVEAENEVWERVMKENTEPELDVKREDSRIAMPVKDSAVETGNENQAHTVPPGMKTLAEAVYSDDSRAVGAVMGIIGHDQTVKQLSALRINDSYQLETIVMSAARGGDTKMFYAVLRYLRQTLSESQIADVLKARGRGGCSLLTAAAEGGNDTIFVDVSVLMGGKDTVWGTLSDDEARCLVKMAAKSGNLGMFSKAKEAVLSRGKRAGSLALDSSGDPNQTSVVVEAARSGSGDMVDAVVAAMSDIMPVEKVIAEVVSSTGPRRMSVLMVAAESGSVGAVAAVMKALPTIVAGAKIVRNMVTAKDVHGMTALHYASTSGVLEIIRIVSTLMARYLSPSKMLDVYSATLAGCCANLSIPVKSKVLEVVSYLLQHGAKPGALDLTRLSTSVPFPLLKATLLGAVSSANNPFIPGMNLSVALAVAARIAVEGEKRALLSMQAAVDELLVEVLENLPQTVRGFEGQMKACSAVFEPETVISGHKGTAGPLSVALQKRQQMDTYCTIPLVLDFMWRKFTKGLPSLRDTEGVLDNDKEFSNPGQTLYGDGMLADSMALQSGYGDGKLSSFSYFPGARFVIVGLLSRPDSYYKVPALRMVLDLVTYVCMMSFFAGYVLFNDEKAFDWTEIIFAFYVVGAIVAEVLDAAENAREYFLDRWNILDVSCLCLMFAGLCVRAFDPADWVLARSLYALSAPLAFTRILFFAQILPSQGPMIQVLFSMTGELVKFGVVMLVVMSGFVVSFYSIFQHNVTFGLVWLNAFKAMLGETEYFDDFSGSVFDTIATLLLVLYLLIMTIMMLNLLIAVLSTAHARIDNNVDQEYKISKARMIQHYVNDAKIDRLPSPFNLLQSVLSFPTLVVDWCFHTTIHAVTKRFVGRAVFWVMIGPIAVATGWLLWISSVPKTVTVLWQRNAGKAMLNKIALVTLATAINTIISPFWLLVLWVKGGFAGMRRVIVRVRNRSKRVCCRGEDRVNTARSSRESSLQDLDGGATGHLGDVLENVVMVMLNKTEGGLGVGELQKYLDDPMSDPHVRRDEQTRATTVEHVKLLRNRLEATTKEHIEDLQSYVIRAAGDLSLQVGRAAAVTEGDSGSLTRDGSDPSDLKRKFNARFNELEIELDGKTAKVEERMEAMIDQRLGVFAQKLETVLRTAGKKGGIYI